jgi:hypothetical protein
MSLEKLLYKKEFRGRIKKEGKTYNKYTKVHRFPFLNKKPAVYLLLLVLLLVLLIAALYQSPLRNPKLNADKPQQERQVEINYQE